MTPLHRISSNSALATGSGTSFAAPLSAGTANIVINQMMNAGYQLGSQNLGLVVNALIQAHLSTNGVLFSDFDPNASPPPPNPPRQQNPPVSGNAPPVGQSDGHGVTSLEHIISLAILTWLLLL